VPLFYFKYFAALNNEIFALLETYNLRWPLPEIKLILPIGISFYTFMAIGYTIDVYNEEIEPEKNIGILALFVSFFPLILSGPIERAKNILPQFKKLKVFDYHMAVQGLKLILWGYFMKLVVADRLGIYIDAVYKNITQHNGTSLLFASFLYPFQVYADLGGYSLIAIGTAKILGINVMQNFKRPFFATSMSEFWRRWHISLISWLTDYVYTPLSFAFRKYSVWGIVIALMITFFISGIWHGLALTFIIWGLIQGILLSSEALISKKRFVFEDKYHLRNKWWYTLICCGTTYVLFSFSQIFGRSSSVNEACLVINKIFSVHGKLFIDKPSISIGSMALFLLLLKDFKDEYKLNLNFLSSKFAVIRYISIIALISIILLFGVFDGSQFIYFQF
jgi:D-alanyl-lipoteichoic acid acyltransferase DltB (MBOAT superfamily)